VAEIVMKRIEELTPYEKNPRKNDDAVEFVANSIREFGFQSPIIIDENNIILNGHTRYKASKRLEMEEVPCIVVAGLSDSKKKAFRLADNKTSERSNWDYELLVQEINDITDIDIKDFGFTTEELSALNIESISLDEFLTDEKKEKKAKTVTCPHCGEIIEL